MNAFYVSAFNSFSFLETFKLMLTFDALLDIILIFVCQYHLRHIQVNAIFLLDMSLDMHFRNCL